MPSDKLRLDIGAFLQSFDDKDPNKQLLNLAFQSLEKRNRFGKIYLHELEKCLTDYKLPLERAGLQFTDAGNLFSNRTYYEAYSFAFVQNMHAALDSLPFIVFMMLGPMSYDEKGMKKSINVRSCGWTKNFLSAVEETFPAERKICRMLGEFVASEKFLVLQAMVNKSKHQSLIRILNNGESISFEEVEYQVKPKAKPKKIREINIRNFMRESSNELFPALFEIVRELHEMRKRTQAPRV